MAEAEHDYRMLRGVPWGEMDGEVVELQVSKGWLQLRRKDGSLVSFGRAMGRPSQPRIPGTLPVRGQQRAAVGEATGLGEELEGRELLEASSGSDPDLGPGDPAPGVEALGDGTGEAAETEPVAKQGPKSGGRKR